MNPARCPIDHPLRAMHVAHQAETLDWHALETIVHADPGRRGLAGFRRNAAPLDRGQLRAAATHVATGGRAVAILTGFCAVVGKRVTAETDGPPAALALAQVLSRLGIEAHLISDRHGVPLLAAGCRQLQLATEMVHEFPFPPADSANDAVGQWIEQFLAGALGRRLTHLVAIERPGPSHTLESLLAQPRDRPAPVTEFAAAVPPSERDVCHTMRGVPIDIYTAPTHRLFDEIRRWQLPITTIGIGDGGNEIGMGRFAWEDLVEAVGDPPGGRIACRTATDFTLIAGVSNWGGYALALAVARLLGAPREAIAGLEPRAHAALIETLVAAGAVDGRTFAAEPTVDGLPLTACLEPLRQLQERLLPAE